MNTMRSVGSAGTIGEMGDRRGRPRQPRREEVGREAHGGPPAGTEDYRMENTSGGIVRVTSPEGNVYEVDLDKGEFGTCTCEAGKYEVDHCKHRTLVRWWRKSR